MESQNQFKLCPLCRGIGCSKGIEVLGHLVRESGTTCTLWQRLTDDWWQKKSHAKTFRPETNLLRGLKIQALNSVTLTAKLLVSGRFMSICPFESDCMSFSPEETNAPPEVDENKLHMTTKTFSNGEFTGFLLSINILLFGSLRIFLLTILVVPNFQNSKCSVWLQTALSYHLLVVDRNSVQMLH